MRNQRGIALVITLLVVALLTITVVEFTYSVEVDQHMTRNALFSLQASLLVRSGINMGEAFLLRDIDPQVDAFTEEWCPQVGPEGQSCLIDEGSTELVVPENMRLRVQIFDESGKVNLNYLRPLNVQEWRAYQQNPENGRVHAWVTLLGRLLEGRGVDGEVAESVMNYWGKLIELYFPGPVTPGAGATPTAHAVPTAAATPGQLAQLDFPSLDDASVIPGLTPGAIRKLRPVLTALDTRRWGGAVNINTAPRQVLNAIIGQSDVVDNIISQRQEAPLKESDKGALLAAVTAEQGQPNTVQFNKSLLVVRSSFFLIRASAIINSNPLTGKGGISRSAAMLVRRDPKPGVGANAPAGTPRWTLTRLDWQKEGGAALFQQKPDPELGTGESSPDML